MNNAPIVQSIKNLYKRFPVNENETEVLHDINFEFRVGEFVAIVGGSRLREIYASVDHLRIYQKF